MVGAVGFRKQWCGAICAALMAYLLAASPASAQDWWDSTRDGIPVPSLATSLPKNGDPDGSRKRLAERGLVYGLEYTNDVLSNLRGGLKTGTIDQDKLQAILTVDFDKLAGLRGLTGFANVFLLHNTGYIRRDYVGGINSIAAIEAQPTVRLSEIWLEQKFWNDKASIRFGQLAADAEFFISEISTGFLQSDWPTIIAVDLPNGGPAYPLSTPGVRFRLDPAKGVALLAAIYNGDPAGPGVPGEEQSRNRYGLNFRVSDPPFAIGEAQFQHNTGAADPGLATTLKLGGWYHFGSFDSLRFAYDGRPLADPAGLRLPAHLRGNSGVYAIVDQQIYRPAGGDAQSGITVYSRMSVSPSDRNLVSHYIDGGIVFAGLVPGRPKDWFGASAIHARFSDSVRAFELESIVYTGRLRPIRDYETGIEFTYSAQIVPGWTVQPDLQFIRHPAGIAQRNATVAGVRSQWRY